MWNANLSDYKKNLSEGSVLFEGTKKELNEIQDEYLYEVF